MRRPEPGEPRCAPSSPSPPPWACSTAALLGSVPGTAGTATAATRDSSARASSVALRVASFNVRSVSLDRAVGEDRPWAERRGAVIAQILGEGVDVIGVQEVNPSKAFASRLVDGPNQFLDLRNGLNKAGGSYALTNRFAFNCKKSSTQHHCKKKNRKASHAERILYNTQTVSLVKKGKLKYAAQVGASQPGLPRVGGAEVEGDRQEVPVHHHPPRRPRSTRSAGPSGAR